MKSLKTFNLDHDVIDLLRRAPNKSQTVCRAVRRFYSKQESFTGLECDTIDLVRWLTSKKDEISPQLYQLLLIEYSTLANQS